MTASAVTFTELTGAAAFAPGVLTVIVVVPPGTVDVMRRVMVLVLSSSLDVRQ